MVKKKDVLSVEEAMEQFKDAAKKIQPVQYLTDHIGKAAMAAFIAGGLSADSVKVREDIAGLVISVIKKFIK